MYKRQEDDYAAAEVAVIQRGDNDDDNDDDLGHITGEEQPVLLGCRFVDKDFAPQNGPSGTFSSNGVLAAAAAAADDDDDDATASVLAAAAAAAAAAAIEARPVSAEGEDLSHVDAPTVRAAIVD